MDAAIDDHQIIHLIVTCRFPSDAPNVLRSVFNDMMQYRGELLAGGVATVSAAAIRGWFYRSPRATPRRSNAKRFLHGYLIWVGIDRCPPESHDQFRKLRHFLQSFGVPRKASRSTARSQEIDRLRQPEALLGTYQVIRPHSSWENCYIFELMSIAALDDGRCVIRMYSHNSLEHVYEGELLVGGLYSFGLLCRALDRPAATPAMRCVALYTGRMRQADGTVYACVSGLLLRGVAGDPRPTRAVGTPFVALKHHPAAHLDFTIPDFDDPYQRLARWADHPHLVVGEIRGRTFGYDFCAAIFQHLRGKLLTGLTLSTIRPDEIAGALNIDPSIEGAFFDAWRSALDDPPSNETAGNPQLAPD